MTSTTYAADDSFYVESADAARFLVALLPTLWADIDSNVRRLRLRKPVVFEQSASTISGRKLVGASLVVGLLPTLWFDPKRNVRSLVRDRPIVRPIAERLAFAPVAPVDGDLDRKCGSYGNFVVGGGCSKRATIVEVVEDEPETLVDYEAYCEKHAAEWLVETSTFRRIRKSTARTATGTGERKARTSKPRPVLPKIVRFLGSSDSGEFGNATCPHCGALGRYVSTFECEDGTRRGAMAGCIRLFPVSPIAEVHARIEEKLRKPGRYGDAPKLTGWDTKILAAIDAFYAGTIDEKTALRKIEDEDRSRRNWTARKYGRR